MEPSSASRSARELDDDFADVDDDVRAFVRGLGLPGRPAPPIDQLAPGTRLAPHLEVTSVLGRGAMGVVYLARDLRLHRDVAVKVVDAPTPRAAGRLEREARALARLKHPNVVTVHDVGVCAGGLYIAMEHVEGGTLRQWLAAAPRSRTEIVDAFLQAARGLYAAHVAGLLHRDFKPDNVLVGASGRVRVGDFGLARAWEDARDVGSRPPPDPLGVQADATDDVAGTPAYLAPEVVLRRETGPLADQFALGVSLFEALCGHRPYAPPGAWTAEPGNVRRPDPDLPAWLRAVMLRAVALEPAARFPDVDALARAIEHGLGRASRRRRTVAIAAIAVLAVGGGVALGTWVSADPCAGTGAALDATWGPQRRGEVASAFAATESPLASAASATVDARLDAWAEAWRAQRHEACTAARSDSSPSDAGSDRRIDCLDRVAVELGALVDVLLHADVEVVARTDELVGRLPAPAICMDPRVVQGGELVPADQRALHETLFAALVAAEEQYAAGRSGRAHVELDALVAQIDDASFRGLGARARLARGRLLHELGRRAEATQDLAAAHALAVAVDDRILQLQLMVQLARTVGSTSAGTDEALRLLAAVDAVDEHRTLTGIDGVELDAARVEVLFFGDRLAQAEQAAREGLAHAPADHPKRTRLLSLLGSSLKWQHRNDEAIVAHEEAVAAAEAVRGPEHPAVAAALGNLAMTQMDLGRYDEALGTLYRALAIREASLGAEAPAVGQTHKEIGEVLREKGDRHDAVAAYERALAIHRAAGDEAGTVFATVALATVLVDLDRAAEGVAALRAILPTAERQFGPESPNLAKLHSIIASHLFRLEELEDAHRHGERGLALLEQALGPNDVAVGFHCLTHARVSAELGRPDVAMVLLDRAQRVFAAALPPDAVQHADVVESRADVLVEMGRVAEAAHLRGESVAVYERALGNSHPEVIERRFRQGRDLLAAGDRARARDALERALVSAEGVEIHPGMPARIRWLLADALWPDRTQRARARSLAAQALAEMRALDHVMLPELEAWMSARGIAP